MPISTSDIPFDDQPTFDLLSRGETYGIFQLASAGMKGLLKQVKPKTLDDVSVVLALFRPGPLDSGATTDYVKRRNVGLGGGWRIHDELEILDKTLEPTYGIIVYQEQILQALNLVCDWSYGDADLVFNALRKKDVQKLAKAKPSFMSAGKDNGFSMSALEALWSVIEPFADYSFNKAHSMGYAYLAYRGAYLKANYPRQYMAAVLTRQGKIEDVAEAVAECRRMGIAILPPDVNKSLPVFKPVKEGIRYGLQSIKGVGADVAALISNKRPYSSIDEFIRDSDPSVLNSRVFEALTKSGSLDSLWEDRAELLAESQRLTKLSLASRRRRDKGQSTAVEQIYHPLRAEGTHRWEGVTESGSGEARQASEGRRRRASDERELLGAEFSTGRVRMILSRGLSEIEWQWVRQMLSRRYQSQPVHLSIDSPSDSPKEVPLHLKTTYSDELAQYFDGLGVKLEEI